MAKFDKWTKERIEKYKERERARNRDRYRNLPPDEKEKIKEQRRQRYHNLNQKDRLKYLQKARARNKTPEVKKQKEEALILFKSQCVAYKGGKCQRCGLVDDPCVYDFHHRDPNEKDFGLASRRKYGFIKSVKLELDKCDLLCSNCHRKEHHAKKPGN